MKIKKPYTRKQYADLAKYCNDNGMIISDNGDYLESVYLPKPQPTEQEMKDKVRSIRNQYLSSTDFTQLPDAPFTEEEKSQYTQYRQYLRDYTEGENWWKQNPKTFEEWK